MSRPSLRYGALLAALFVYLAYARLHEANETFLLLRDQMRDWRIALGPFSSLPLVGPQSTAGGSSLGPVYYWVLWASRWTIGTWMDNLPQAGAYGIALFHGAADLLLVDSLRRRVDSVWVAVAAVLLVSTGPHELAVSSTIWNPAVSVAFIKLAMALRLRHDRNSSLWWTAATAAAAWCAVQAHSAAVFPAAAIVGSYIVDDLLSGRFRRALQQLRGAAEVIVVLQIPFVIHALTQPGEAIPTRALGGAGELLASGGARWQPSLQAFLASAASLLFAPWQGWVVWRMLLVVCAIAIVLRYPRDAPLLSVTVAPLCLTVLGLAFWPGNYDAYWYLPVAPCVSTAIALSLGLWRPGVTGPIMVALIVTAQPSRLAASDFSYRMREFGPLLRGTRRIVRQTHELRRLETSFPMPPFSDQTFLYEVLGGRFSETAEFDAVIDETGDAQFRRVAR
jgi:hypothetical protein